MSETDLEKKVSQYAQLAKEDKNIDVASLLLNALENEQVNLLKPSTKRWGYLISLSIPPAGLLFAAWFWFSGKDDGKKAAWVCIALTAVTIVLFWIGLSAFTSTSGVGVDQIKKITPAEIHDTLSN